MVKMDENVLVKAMELGNALAQSKITLRAKAADELQKNDIDAQLLMTAYNRKYQDMVDSFKGKQPTPEELAQFKKTMDKEAEKLKANAVIKEYIEARDEYEAMMNEVNTILTSAVSGEGGGCSGNCSSCSGCH